MYRLFYKYEYANNWFIYFLNKKKHGKPGPKMTLVVMTTNTDKNQNIDSLAPV